MRRLVFKGGYGEHGRSCFLVQYNKQNRYYMVDCGIMDSDVFPYPELSVEEVQAVDYLFVTHCHKDHAGAVHYMIEKGFNGWLITSHMTVELGSLEYDKILCLPVERSPKEQKITLQSMQVEYGKSGHCPGGLWFRIEDVFGSCFFTGDYQADNLLYACDKVKGMQADLAVVDCAHFQTMENADGLRTILCNEVEEFLKQKKRIILPVPEFGRGIEMFCMMKQFFSQAKIKVDTGFATCGKKMLEEENWYKKEIFVEIQKLLATEENIVQLSLENADKEAFDILMIADTHLQKDQNAEFVQHIMEKAGVLIITGRIKKGSLPEKLYAAGCAVKHSYPHHQSRGDMLRMIEENKFKVVYPFHNPLKEVYLRD